MWRILISMVVNFKLIFNLLDILFEQLVLIGNVINYFEWKKERVRCLIFTPRAALIIYSKTNCLIYSQVTIEGHRAGSLRMEIDSSLHC